VNSELYTVWEAAKPKGDFAAVLPLLEKSFELARREAELVGYKDHPYDVLLDKYEPGASIKTLKPTLTALGDRLAVMIPQIIPMFAGCPELDGNFPIAQQAELGKKVVTDLGYDLTRGRIDTTAHPFMTTLGANDYRIATRFNEKTYLSGLSGNIHEAGHALYEQGLKPELAGTGLGKFISLGIHESQSRLYENLIGRSRPFCEYLYRTLAAYFPEEQARTNPETIWKQSNLVKPSLIRIDADEVTYSQHIIIRTLLEEEVISGKLAVKDLPGRWNEMYKQYLGVEPPHAGVGVMQDVHWYCGLVGYFPTYVLGNLYGAAMMEKVRQEMPNLDTDIANGEFKPLLGWLRTNVHQHGRRYSAEELIQRITGAPLSSGPFLRYLEGKFDLKP
jgi:carboxypeptidase Taq